MYASTDRDVMLNELAHRWLSAGGPATMLRAYKNAMCRDSIHFAESQDGIQPSHSSYQELQGYLYSSNAQG